jgi:hypothetical protein
MAFLKREEEEDVREIALVGETARFMPQWDEQIIGPQNTYKIEKEEKTKPLPLQASRPIAVAPARYVPFQVIISHSPSTIHLPPGLPNERLLTAMFNAAHLANRLTRPSHSRKLPFSPHTIPPLLRHITIPPRFRRWRLCAQQH